MTVSVQLPASGKGRDPWLVASGLLCTAVVSLLPCIAVAQDTQRAVTLRFSLDQRLETDSNLGLDTPGQGRTNQANTRLSFQAISDTGISQLSFGLAGAVRVIDGPETSGTELNLADPDLTFGYDRASANAEIGISAALRERDIATLRSLDEFRDADGNIDLPEDFNSLTGEGTRRNASLDVNYRWGLAAPFGGSVSAGFDDLTYVDTTATDLVDSRRYYAGTGLRFDLSEVTELTADLRYSVFDEDGVAVDRNTLRFDTGVSIARPDGRFFGRLTAEDTEDGTRMGLTFGRDLQRPAGALSASIGVTRDIEGDLHLTGSITGQQDLANGALSGSLQRSVRSDRDDAEELLTSLRIGYRHDLSALSALSLDFAYADSQGTLTDGSTTDASLSATYNRALTADWSLDLGYSHRTRDDEIDGRADSDSVFLGLRRVFTN